jgi:D-3-phosphoglycerate dehydrogenase
VTVLRLAATKGLFAAVVEEQVTYVNAPHIAADRGVGVTLTAEADSVEESLLVSLTGALPDGRRVSVAGTLHGGFGGGANGAGNQVRLTQVDGFDLELSADGVLLFFRYADRPGVVGTVGTILGGAGMNIAAMQVARRAAGGEALMTLTVDSPVAADLLAKAAEAIGATAASAVDLTD